ncbi:hypothetical protein AAG906_001797 [Vitis piasezkii]
MKVVREPIEKEFYREEPGREKKGTDWCISVCTSPVDYAREGLLNAVEVRDPNLEEESRLSDSNVIVVSWEK